MINRYNVTEHEQYKIKHRTVTIAYFQKGNFTIEWKQRQPFLPKHPWVRCVDLLCGTIYT